MSCVVLTEYSFVFKLFGKEREKRVEMYPKIIEIRIIFLNSDKKTKKGQN